MRTWAGRLLRRLADRIDEDNAPRSSGLSFTFEANRGSAIHGELGCHRATHKGVLLFYRPEDYDRAWMDADNRPPRVLWENINEGRRPFVEYPSMNDVDPCACDEVCPHGETCLAGHANYPDSHWYPCPACTPTRTVTFDEARRLGRGKNGDDR